jgi:hypothetical protein
MARLNLKKWKNQETLNARDYVYEREQIIDDIELVKAYELDDLADVVIGLEPEESGDGDVLRYDDGTETWRRSNQLTTHIANTSNPHAVTKTQVGLGNVDNTSDLNKPISTATQDALDTKEPANANIQAHIVATNNPHQVTKAQVGLGNADNTSDLNKPVSTAQQTALNLKVNTSVVGAANGVATLDNQGKVPFAQLPASVTGGMRFSGTINASAGTTEANAVGLDTLFTELTFANWATTSQQSTGIYKVVTHAGFIKNVDGTSGSTAYHQFSPNQGLAIGEEGDNTSPIYLELGDWIVFSSAANPAGGFNYFFYSIINNTYADASIIEKGVVKLGYTSNGKNEKVDTTVDGLFVNLEDYYNKTETDELIQVAKQIQYYPNTKNDSGSTIFKGDVVQFAGSQGDFIKIKRAVASEINANPEALMGLAESDILDGQFGNVVWFGQVKEFNTGSLTLGQVLYFDTSSGSLTATEPATNKIIVAAVEKVSSGGGSNGILLVRIKWVSRDIDEVDGLQTALNTVGQVAGFSTKLGFEALNSVTAGDRFSTAVGYFALRNNTTGLNNTAYGVSGLRETTTGSSNTAIGRDAIGENTTGSNNTASGFQAGRFIANGTTANQTGSSSVFIGADTKALAGGQTNQIVIGHNATGIGSNTVTLGNDSIVTTALKGNVGIGTTSPASKLELRQSVDTLNGGLIVRDTVGGSTGRAYVSGTSFFLGQGANTNLVLTSAGNVGINETSPTAQLQVKSSATNKVPLIVDTIASHTENLQVWRNNNTTVAFVNRFGNFFGDGLINTSNANNASISTATIGTTISRNIADANDALTINLANASSTGLILDAQAAGTTVASIAKNGTVTAPSVVATSTVKIGAWVLSQNATSGSLDFVIG